MSIGLDILLSVTRLHPFLHLPLREQQLALKHPCSDMAAADLLQM